MKQPGERYLHGSSLESRRGCVQRRRLQRSEASQRKERHIRYALACEVIDKAIVLPVRNVVQVLQAYDLRDLPSLRQLSGSDVAQAEMRISP